MLETPKGQTTDLRVASESLRQKDRAIGHPWKVQRLSCL
jgi:hypothetical protein